jgi:hypothetical protein
MEPLVCVRKGRETHTQGRRMEPLVCVREGTYQSSRFSADVLLMACTLRGAAALHAAYDASCIRDATLVCTPLILRAMRMSSLIAVASKWTLSV